MSCKRDNLPDVLKPSGKIDLSTGLAAALPCGFAAGVGEATAVGAILICSDTKSTQQTNDHGRQKDDASFM